MTKLRRVALVPVLCLLLAGGLQVAQGAELALPEKVIVHDGRTSPPLVDIAQVRLDASWYWDSQQSVRVNVPNGFRPGHRLTVWFDIKGDSKPDGHYELRLVQKKPGVKFLKKVQEFRLGGGWGHGGKKVSCSGSEGGTPVVDQIRRGQRSVGIYLDLWYCLRTPTAGDGSGSWRAAVSVAKGKKADMVPNNRNWSPSVAGWGPCDPSGGPCN